MKSILSIIIASLFWFGVVYGSLAFVNSSETINTSANANQIEGFFIYSYCKPVSETVYLGTVNVPTVVSDKSTERLKKLISRCKKDFPKAEALIVSDDFGKADAITFKND